MGIALVRLSEADRIAIAEKLFKVTGREKDELHGLCPIHDESNPSFSYNFVKDTYHCFSCGADGDLCDLWARISGYTDSKEGFKAFCAAYSIKGSSWIDAPAPGGNQGHQAQNSEPSTAGYDETAADDTEPDKFISEDLWAQFPPLPEDWIRRLEESRGWTRRMIEILDIRQQKFYLDKQGRIHEVKKPEKISIPVRDRAGRIVNIRHYQPGAKRYKIISWGKAFGQARLFPPAPTMDFVPILLCEGESDTICALSKGFNAITQTSKTKNWSQEHLEPFRGREAVIAYDADQPGQKYATFAARCVQEVARSVRMLVWPDLMGRLDDGTWPDDHGQDLTDYFIKHGKTPADLQALMDAALPFDEDRDGGVMRFFDHGVNDRLSFKPRLLAEKILKDVSLAWEPSTGLLYRWTGRIWEVYDEDHLKALCIKYLENEAQKSRVEDAVFQAIKLSTIAHGRLMNDRKEWVCVQNGMLNLRTLDLKPHDKDFLSTFMLPVDFAPDSKPKCDRFLQYLKETIKTPGPIMQVQEFAGYSLTYGTEFQKCLLLLGPGADGKSILLNILRELVGPENCASVSFQDLENEFHRSSLYGKLLNISTEVGSKAMESPYFKAIVAGDPLSASFKHKNTFTFKPTCKQAFAANRLPRVLDNSDGYFRRLLPIEFKRQFLTDGDPFLFDELKKEMTGIFHWAIIGLHRLWDQRRFTDCDETRRLMIDYKRINNPVLCYVEDRCELVQGHEIAKDALYSDYRSYCGKNGYQIMSRENFFRELKSCVSTLKEHRPTSKDGARTRTVEGISLKMDIEGDNAA